MKNPIIIALDYPRFDLATKFLKNFESKPPFVKVGMELYLSEGPSIIQKLKDNGFKVFLDLKLHDIPTTVNRTCKSLATLGVDILNVHALGGKEMLQAARDGFREKTTEGKLIGVTVLTSTTIETLKNDLFIYKDLDKVITHYAQNTFEAGLDGVVCSPLDVKLIKENTSKDFLCITPGVRPQGSDTNDQKRIMTPAQAIKEGSDYLVIGRPITKAQDPFLAYEKILKELQ